MAQKTLEETFHATRETDFDQNFWNRFLGELGARFRSLESIKIDWETVSQEGIQVALDRINEVLGPAAERVQNIAALGFLTVESHSARTLANGVVNFIAVAGDQLDLFVPTPFVAVTRAASPTDFAIGQVIFFDRATGSIDIQISYFEGDPGPHSDWTISAVAGQALAQSTLLNQSVAARDLATAAKEAAVAARGDAVAALSTINAYATATLGYRNSAQQYSQDASGYATATLAYRDQASGFASDSSGWSAKSRQYAVSMSLIDGTDYSAKYWANQASLQGVPIGTTIWQHGNGATTPPGYIKVVPGLEITASTPDLRAWAIANGWATNGSGNPVFPSVESFFPRSWRPGQTGNDAGRVFPSIQQDATQLVTGSFRTERTTITNFTGAFKDGLVAGGVGNSTAGSDAGKTVTFDNSLVARTAAETRPVNLPFTVYIKAYNQAVDAATVAAAQVLSDLADARARLTALEGRVLGFESVQLTPSLAGLVTSAHTLGVKPKRCRAYLVCVNTEGGWAPNDELAIGSDNVGSASGYGASVYADASNIYARIGNAGLASLLHKTTGVQFTPTVANWKVILRAWP